MNRVAYRVAHWGISLGFVLLLVAPVSPVFAFGGVGDLGECASFTGCTAKVASSSVAIASYDISLITGGYVLPVELSPGLNTFRDQDASFSTAPAAAAVGVLCEFCATSIPFFSTAIANSQSDFGTNRASGFTTIGANGTDVQAVGRTVDADIRTIAIAASAWRDVWSFNTAGHFSATIALDGTSRAFTDNVRFFVPTFDFSPVSTQGDWFYELRVWDVTNQSVSEDFELGGPTAVARARDSAALANEQRARFASDLALEFDFESGVQYVVTAELRVDSRNGRDIDLFNTVRLTDIALSNGANLSALSGHDYQAPVITNVSEPLPGVVFATGLACLALARRRVRS